MMGDLAAGVALALVVEPLRVPLTVEGHPRILSGPSPDPSRITALQPRVDRDGPR